jgi:serine/threonine-protein kinase RIM15
MAALYEIIAVATDISEMSVAQLTSQPKLMGSMVQRVQNIGRIWDDHPDWHGRNWYVQVLLAVASLSRVVEWWEAEKQFWNFDDNEEEQGEPLMFVTKPADEPVPLPSDIPDSDVDGFKLNPEEDTRTQPPTPPTITRKSRDEQPRQDSTPSRLAPPAVGSLLTLASPSKIIQAAESARVLATERLRLQAETAQNQNIVMELSLDGDHFIWVNHAWRVVVGYASHCFGHYILPTLLSEPNLMTFLDHVSQAYCCDPTLPFSKKPVNDFKKMTRTPLKFGLSSV